MGRWRSERRRSERGKEGEEEGGDPFIHFHLSIRLSIYMDPVDYGGPLPRICSLKPPKVVF